MIFEGVTCYLERRNDVAKKIQVIYREATYRPT